MSDLKSLFEGSDLSEEFKQKAEVIFAAQVDEAVNVKTTEITTKLQEEFDVKVQDKIEAIEEASKAYLEEEVAPAIDKYLTAAVQEWIKENTVALEASAKVSLAESFLTGLTGLAAEHKLTLPEGQDQVVVLQTKVDELSEKAKELLDANIELQKENVEFKKSQVVAEVTKELSESQKEKFGPVAAKVEFKTAEQFNEALKSLVVSYFPAVASEEDKDAALKEATEKEAAAKLLKEQGTKLSPEDQYYANMNKALRG